MTPGRGGVPTPGVRLLVTIGVGFVPWLVVRLSDTWGVVVAAGLVGRGPLKVT